jgi:hypothetical protein
MPLQVDLIEEYSAGDHRYTVFEPTAVGDWQGELAAEYRRLRTACAVPVGPITVEGIGIVGVDRLQQYLQNYTIPVYKPGNLGIVRSDFGEVIGCALLTQLYGTKLGYIGVCHRETIQLSGRGIDLIGIEEGEAEDEPLTLVLTEVKVSGEAKSPPAVVDKNDDCLRIQHLFHIANRTTTVAKIWNQSRQILDIEVRDLFFRVAVLLEESWSNVRLVACSVMVRPRLCYTPADFGSFAKTPEDFQPANVRFLVLCVPGNGNIDSVVENWYEVVKAPGPEESEAE